MRGASTPFSGGACAARSSMQTGILLQINISPGGMPKRPIDSAHITIEGVTGDWQNNRKYHGGDDRAICLFSEELYNRLRHDFGIDLVFGAVGENFTTCGIDLDSLQSGDRLRVGECLIEITDVRIPCGNLKKWDARLPKVIEGHSGWVCKVLETGDARPGDRIEVLPART
jgi:MOSC domain-containing protein YiiM